MRKPKSRYPTAITFRDEEIFLFLWKWKLATTKTIAYVFFGHASLVVAYQRLCKLRKAEYLRQRMDEGGRNQVWTLDKKGFQALVNRLPELEEYGYASENIEHDLLVNALHQGSWSRGCPNGVQIFTEQQLRRMKPEMYPDWVPSSKSHRPDGYWHIKNGDHSMTIAIEVELSAKSKDRYESVVSFYDHYDSIDRILWLVSTKQLGNKILGASQNSKLYRRNIHNFILLEPFQTHLWQTPIVSGPNKGMTVLEMLNPNPLDTLIESPLKPSYKGSSNQRNQHLLDTSSTPQNRLKKTNFNIRSFPD